MPPAQPSASSTLITASPAIVLVQSNDAIALRFCWALFSRKSAQDHP
jgi:hypothetical protein